MPAERPSPNGSADVASLLRRRQHDQQLVSGGVSPRGTGARTLSDRDLFALLGEEYAHRRALEGDIAVLKSQLASIVAEQDTAGYNRPDEQGSGEDQRMAPTE